MDSPNSKPTNPPVAPASNVRAKFLCEANNGQDIILRAVYDSDPKSENGQFFQYTPSGSINLSTVNPAAAALFVRGQEYFVDFTRAN